MGRSDFILPFVFLVSFLFGLKGLRSLSNGVGLTLGSGVIFSGARGVVLLLRLTIQFSGCW